MGGGGNCNSFRTRIIEREMTKGEMMEVCRAVSWGRWVKSCCFEERQAQHEVHFNVACRRWNSYLYDAVNARD